MSTNIHSENFFNKQAVQKIGLYSAEKRRLVADLINAMGAYYKKDLSDQVTLWIADLIDLNEDDLKAAWEHIRLSEDSGYTPQPSKIRKIALDIARRRQSEEHRLIAALDEEISNGTIDVGNTQLLGKRMSIVRRVMSGEKISYAEALQVFGKKSIDESMELHKPYADRFKPWIKDYPGNKLQSTAPVSVEPKDTFKIDDTWT